MSVTSCIPASTALFALTDTLQPIRRSWGQAVMTVLAEFVLPSSLTAAVILASRSGDAGIRQNVLAEEVGVNPGAMLRILVQAEAAGLLERRASAVDRRVNTVHILPKGQCLADKMEAAVADLREALLGDLPFEAVKTATRVIQRFGGRIGASL